jgi:hypothetical protein
MFLSAHLLTGMSVGVAVGNPYLAAPLGLVSHYVLDFLPHFEGSSLREPGDRTEGFKNWVEWLFVGLDLLFVVFIIFYFHRYWHWAPVVGGFLGCCRTFLIMCHFGINAYKKLSFFKCLKNLFMKKYIFCFIPLKL